MVKPLTFKGDKRIKKRKRTKEDVDDDNPDEGGSSRPTAIAKAGSTTDEPEGWVTMEQPEELTGPIMFTFVSLYQSYGE